MLARSLLRPLRLSVSTLRPAVAIQPRHYSATVRSQSERDSESKISSKDELKPRNKEETRSSTHEKIASDNTAFDPNVTNPRQEKRNIGKDEGTAEEGADNPLEYSSATPESSHMTRDDRTVKGKEHGPSGGSKAA